MADSTQTALAYYDSISTMVWPSVKESIIHPASKFIPFWDNEYWVLFIVWFVTFILEQILPKQKKYAVVGRKGFWLDLFYLFFIDFLFRLIGFVALTYTIEYVFTNAMSSIGIQLPLVNLGNLPLVVKFLLFFIIMDFFEFYSHYLLHRINFFWKFHKIHHAQETLGFASTRHFHFMEYLVLRPLAWIPMGILGFSDHSYIICTAVYMWIGYFLTFFSHCNVKVNFGFLNKIIITPNTHYWHHAKNIPRKYGVNYASMLVIWDHLFKSYYLPEDPKLEPMLGVPDNDVPKNFLGQMWHPFKELFSGKKDSQMMIPNIPKKKKN
jgi:sterol desaturase/sphingolipid hydroxylase (fatty acid hydroxylase superfamily)